MARRLRSRYGATPEGALCVTPAEALRPDACGGDLAIRLRKRYDVSSTEALWRVVCGSAMAQRLQKRYGATPAEAL